MSSSNYHEMADVNRGSFLGRFSFRSRGSGVGFDNPWNRIIVYGFLFVTVTATISGFYFFAMFLEDRDINAAVWAFFTAGISLCLGSLFVLHLLRRLEYWHDKVTLEGIKVFGMTMSVISGTSLGVYLILGFLRQQTFDTEEENYFRASLFSGLCLGCNLLTYYAAQWYQNIMMPKQRPPPILSLRDIRN